MLNQEQRTQLTKVLRPIVKEYGIGSVTDSVAIIAQGIASQSIGLDNGPAVQKLADDLLEVAATNTL